MMLLKVFIIQSFVACYIIEYVLSLVKPWQGYPLEGFNVLSEFH